jgi:hypothetical protein
LSLSEILSSLSFVVYGKIFGSLFDSFSFLNDDIKLFLKLSTFLIVDVREILLVSYEAICESLF